MIRTLRHTVARGTSTVEFIAMAPFILALMGLIWDLREYISHHTAASREIYVAAEVIANKLDADLVTGTTPFDAVLRRLIDERLAPLGSGMVQASIVARGTTPVGASTGCTLDTDTCLPMVTLSWPPPALPTEGTWNNGGECINFASAHPLGLPAAGTHFAAGTPVLPNEVPAAVTPSLPEDEWVSRNLRTQEWWIVIDSCFHPRPGLFFGNLANLSIELFDPSSSALVVRKRAVWGSLHSRPQCNWCP